MALRSLRSAVNRGDTKDAARDGSPGGGSGLQWGPPAGTLNTLAAQGGTARAPGPETPAWLPQPADQPPGGRWIRGPAALPRRSPSDARRRPPVPCRRPRLTPSRTSSSGASSRPRPAPASASASNRTPSRVRPPAGGARRRTRRPLSRLRRADRRGSAPVRGVRTTTHARCPCRQGVAPGRRGDVAGLVVGGLVVGIALPRDDATAGVGGGGQQCRTDVRAGLGQRRGRAARNHRPQWTARVGGGAAERGARRDVIPGPGRGQGAPPDEQRCPCGNPRSGRWPTGRRPPATRPSSRRSTIS